MALERPGGAFVRGAVQWSTTRLNICAWLPALRGVLQMLVMQNSPQRQSAWLYGQYILPHA